MRKSEHPTSNQLTIRVVVRGLPLPEGARHTIGNVTLLVLGRARAAAWPDVGLEKGDLEGVVWTSTTDLEATLVALARNPMIVMAALTTPGGS